MSGTTMTVLVFIVEATGVLLSQTCGTPAALQIAFHNPSNWASLCTDGNHTKPTSAAKMNRSTVALTLATNHGLRREKSGSTDIIASYPYRRHRRFRQATSCAIG